MRLRAGRNLLGGVGEVDLEVFLVDRCAPRDNRMAGAGVQVNGFGWNGLDG